MYAHHFHLLPVTPAQRKREIRTEENKLDGLNEALRNSGKPLSHVFKRRRLLLSTTNS